jgi:hypothetical protein
MARFDGFVKGVLWEAKGFGYAKLLKGGVAAEVAGRLLNQARRQLNAANGTAIRWLFAEKDAADIVRNMFRSHGMLIEVIHMPMP